MTECNNNTRYVQNKNKGFKWKELEGELTFLCYIFYQSKKKLKSIERRNKETKRHAYAANMCVLCVSAGARACVIEVYKASRNIS